MYEKQFLKGSNSPSGRCRGWTQSGAAESARVPTGLNRTAAIGACSPQLSRAVGTKREAGTNQRVAFGARLQHRLAHEKIQNDADAVWHKDGDHGPQSTPHAAALSIPVHISHQQRVNKQKHGHGAGKQHACPQRPAAKLGIMGYGDAEQQKEHAGEHDNGNEPCRPRYNFNSIAKTVHDSLLAAWTCGAISAAKAALAKEASNV